MRKLFNLFRKNSPEKVSDVKNPYNYYDINGKRYAVSDNMNFKVQGQDNDINIYGWTLEIRFRDSNGELYPNWSTYYNNRIYQSMSSAIDAALKVSQMGKRNSEWRVLPLYKMSQNEFRDYKIDQLIYPNGDPAKPKTYEIKAWKVKEDVDFKYHPSSTSYKYKKGTIFIQLEDGSIQRAATRTEPTGFHDRYQLFHDLIPKGVVEEIDIREEKWVHPHLVKELKIKIKN